MSNVKFNNHQPVFLNAIREKADRYFSQYKLKPTGNFKLYLKTIILVSSLIGFYIWAVFFTPPQAWLAIILCVVIGFNFSLVGFNVMHDGSHGSYSNKKWINRIMALTLNVLGGNAFIWNQKHNVNHHSYSNIEGADDDIDIKPFFRVHKGQKKMWFHRFQHIYFVFFYGMTYFFWVYFRDFKKYFTGMVTTFAKMPKMSVNEKILFWTSKIVHIIIFLVIPIYMIGLVPSLIGYGVTMFVSGFVLAIVFQLAHIVEGTEFVAPSTEVDVTKIDNEWAIHQVKTTANFATRSKTVSWLLGGLNFQVEHHLFPRVSHVHYPKINLIIKETCKEHNIPYLENRTFLSAIISHISYLKKMGRAEYKKEFSAQGAY